MGTRAPLKQRGAYAQVSRDVTSSQDPKPSGCELPHRTARSRAPGWGQPKPNSHYLQTWPCSLLTLHVIREGGLGWVVSQVAETGWTFCTLDRVTGIFVSPGPGAFVTGWLWTLMSAMRSLNFC